MKELVTNHGVVKYDDEDSAAVEAHVWGAYNYAKKGAPPLPYATCCIGSQTIYMHRLVLTAPKHTEVDHINRDTLDNRRRNLRLATRNQNSANKPAQGGSSKFKGVCKANTKSERWRAWVMDEKTSIYLGSFLTEQEAAEAYDAKAKVIWGAYAYLNFPTAPQLAAH